MASFADPGITEQLMRDPQLLAAFTDHLNSLIGTSSGLMESLPKAVKKRVQALKGIQKQHLELELVFHEKVAQLEKEFAEKFSALYQQRQEIVTGAREPTQEELAVLPQEEAEEGVDEEAATGEEGEEEKATEEADADKEEGETLAGDADDEDISGIPDFWVSALSNNEMISELIEKHDIEVLEALTDIRCELRPEPNTGFTLIFEFAENDYFTNSTLTKTYVLDPAPEDETDLIYVGPIFQRAEGTVINWKPGKNVTVKVEKKKQRRKGGAKAGRVRVVEKETPVASFFNFFDPPQVDEGETRPEVIQVAAQLLNQDYEVGEIIREKIIPAAVMWFTGEALDYEDMDMEEEEEEEEEEAMEMAMPSLQALSMDGSKPKTRAITAADEDEESDSDDEAADATWKPPADKPPECKNS
eukprot:m.248100 g.248100  ORF g.248100 m.248100 type:complete len:416 (-) comp15407_c1_seq5:2253-3500(-)